MRRYIRNMRQSTWLLVIFTVFSTLSASAQSEDSLLLPEPTDWRLEKVALPLPFSPDMKEQGRAELRFSAGMFVPSAQDYFTYRFAAEITNVRKLSKRQLKHFLEQYYRGIYLAVSEKKSNGSEIKVNLKRKKTSHKSEKAFSAGVHFYDPFNADAQVWLVLEIVQTHIKDSKMMHLFMDIKADPSVVVCGPLCD